MRIVFDAHLQRWDLEPDGDPIVTPSSRLLPVRRSGTPAMLKISLTPEERQGALVMAWWRGVGAARVLAHEGDALLMERAEDDGRLLEMARGGRDDQASRILCATAATLHAHGGEPLPSLIPMTRRFQALWGAEARYGGILRRCAQVARELLAAPREVTTLHGDIHHGNVLYFGERGWLAIDPKGLLGERGYDFANLFCNPDLEVSTAPGRLALQAHVVAEAAGLERTRLLRWVLAYAGLSAAWSLEDDGEEPALALAVAELAAGELGPP